MSGPTRVLRTGLGRLRSMADRVAHPVRRRRARRTLRRIADSGGSGDGGIHLLFLCHGNICRSPYAAAFLGERIAAEGLGARVDSAGFIGPGRGSPPEAVEVAGERGVDLTGHTSELVTGRKMASADLIVVMEPRQARAVRGELEGARQAVVVLGDLDPEAAGRRAIRDPIFQPPEVFRETFARIDRCVEELVRVAFEEGSRRRAAAGPAREGRGSERESA